ncbi:TIR domain-containing protein [Chloroflexota bacterium]
MTIEKQIPSENVYPSGLQLLYTLRGHEHVIFLVSWNNNGRLLASASEDTSIRIWDPFAGQLIRKLNGHKKGVYCLDWSPDGTLIASGSEDKSILIWDTSSWEIQQTIREHTAAVNDVAWSPDGKTLASASDDGSLLLWDTISWQVKKNLIGHEGGIWNVAWFPNGRRLASASVDKTVRLWEPTSAQVRRVIAEHSDEVSVVAVSPSGEFLVSGSDDTTIMIWNAQTGERVAVLRDHLQWICGISFSYDSKLLASKAFDGTVRIWNSQDWQLLTVLEEPSNRFNYFAVLDFHPHQYLLATLGEQDTAIRLWALDPENLGKDQAKFTKRRLRLFLCHSSQDKSVVRKIFSKLRVDGFDPWLDEENLLPGQDWRSEIQKAIHDSDAVLVCVSSTSVNKAGFLHREIREALDVAYEQPEGSIFLIPIRLDECMVPDSLRHWQWFNYFEENGYWKLRLSLQKRAASLGLG